MNNFTFSAKLETSNSRPSGFDYLRIGLAISVVFWHSFGISYGPAFTANVATGPLRGIVVLILPMFFALSGFLVAGSLLRCKSLVSFLGLRAIRIFPALAVETVISAFIIGSIFTELPLAHYFSQPSFYHYMLNIFGIVHFSLPGVFVDNPFSNIVNGQLWTVPFELECYLVLSLFAVLGVVKKRMWILIGLAGLVVLLAALQMRNVYLHGAEPLREYVTGRQLVVAFVAGVAGFLYHDRLPYHPVLGIGSALCAYIIFVAAPAADLIGVLFASYFTLWVGAMNPRKIFILNGADYSYGIFLYGFAVQQCVKTVLPDLNWLGNFTLSLSIVSIIAALSWHYIEKPALGARTGAMKLEQWFLKLTSQPQLKFLNFVLARNSQ